MQTISAIATMFDQGAIERFSIVPDAIEPQTYNIVYRFSTSVDSGVVMTARGKHKQYKTMASAINDLKKIGARSACIYFD